MKKKHPVTDNRGFGTAPVFFTAISTILGAILFLRFGFATGVLGYWGVILIIFLGHLVTVPTALAISELATNKKVEGGGEYFIISRSFGMDIGATIGIALFMSQAISVAFYVIAFTEAFQFFFDWAGTRFQLILPRQAVSVPVMLLLSLLILKKGAGLGVKTLYIVVGILAVSLVFFFLGKPAQADTESFSLLNAQFRNTDQFFIVFAIVFPAFTGMTAGVGLSGELRNPARSIPVGTIGATLIGMIIYLFITFKLAASASVNDLVNSQLVMADIALAGTLVIPLGLAASTISSALGSVMVAPRTLQALARDRSFPFRGMNNWLSSEREADKEPFNASLVTCIIALAVVLTGDVNAVASIISMFFMVTYGSLCLISVLHHFGASPSYRPSFKSRWFVSLTGFLVAIWVMFKIDTLYALLAIAVMFLIYMYVRSYKKRKNGLESIFANAIFQLSRNLQIYLQQTKGRKTYQEWRPSAICISKDSFKRSSAFELLNWISYKYGFGTYLHLMEGYFSRKTNQESADTLQKLIEKYVHFKNQVYIDTLISPSYTSAIAQAIQIPGIAGMENNMVIFEFDKNDPDNLPGIIDNFALVHAGNFDVCLLGSSPRKIKKGDEIHIWIRNFDTKNSNLMIMLGFIILGHPDWQKSNIRIYNVCKPTDHDAVRKKLETLMSSGRLPITLKNIEVISNAMNRNVKELINEKSGGAGLVIIGLREEAIRHEGISLFTGYEKIGMTVFVNSYEEKTID